MDKDIYLTKVKKSDKASLMELREEFERNGERSAPGSSGFLDYPTFEEWFKFVKLCEKQETLPRKDYVPLFNICSKGEVMARFWVFCKSAAL